MHNHLLLLLFFLGLSTSLQAQFYPTQYRPSQQWQQIETPHFKLIFAQGNDSTARQMSQILEEQYPKARQLVGGALNNFPIILNDYNDRSNGFVTPFHFRSEIELPPIKGKSLNPRSGNWLETVGPHELVHALQFSNLGGPNLPAFISLFSPDLARSFHGAIPSGVTEGLAVYHETKQVAPNGGRGHHPIFKNQFNAVFDSNQRWSMGQMVQTSSNTRPFSRHYIGGYAFTSWLQEEFGTTTSQDALGFYMDFPFLGYGVALRHATGLWPGQLYSRFEANHRKKLATNQDQSPIQPLDIPFKGREIRRPQWLSDSTLVFYGSFYNARSGFYRYDLGTNQTDRLISTNTTGDYRYDLSSDRSKMIYSYYQVDALYDNTYKTELAEYDFSTQKRRKLTDNGRLYAPQYLNDQLFALQTRPATSALVSVHQNQPSVDSITEEFALSGHEVRAVAVHPDHQRLAVVANIRGLQGLWIATRRNLDTALQSAPDISFKDGSVFDPEWHPDGDKLLFSSDFSGVHQLYEYNLRKETVTQITNTSYNAFEGSYSPDGEQLAFIRQVKNERLPVVLDRAEASGQIISSSRWTATEEKTALAQRPVVSDSIRSASQKWSTNSYSSGLNWLKPRMVLPVYEEVSNRDIYRAGLSLHSNNLLQSQSYSAEVSYLEEHLWYDLSYQNKSFYPGFRMELYSEPSYLSFNNNQDGTSRLLRQNRSLSLGIPFNIRLSQNVFSSSLFIEPELRYSQLRFFDIHGTNEESDFTNSVVSNIYGQFNFRLQQNIRDVQPNSGLVLFSELEHYWSTNDLNFSVGQDDINFNFQQPTALHGGLYGYLSPLRRWNQSLRLEVEGLTQSGLVFDNQSLVSDGFSEPVFAGSQNMISVHARYTIPLLFADDGGFLLPFYLNNVYLVAFANSVTDPTYADWYEQSRSVFGLGLRTRFRLSNLAFDIGVGYGYESTRKNHQFFIGNF